MNLYIKPVKPRKPTLLRALAVICMAAVFSAVFLPSANATLLSTRDAEYAVDLANSAIGKPVGEHTLTDQDGEPFKLSALKGRPYVVNLVYTSCGHVCPLITAQLKKGLTRARAEGLDITALTIGFDIERDTIEAMRFYSEDFTTDYARWKFLSADSETIEALTRELGFYYKENPEGGFDHLTMVTIVDPSSRVFTHIFGKDFTAEDFVARVKESLRWNSAEYSIPPKPKSLFEMVKYLCYTYDETTGKFKVDYNMLVSIVVALGAGLLLIGVFVYIFRASAKRKDR